MASQTFGFGIKGLKKYWELIPITSILGAAVVGAFSFMGYALYQKPDVWVKGKTEGVPPWEKADAGPQNMKEFIIGRTHVTYPEIEQLRREIGSYRAR